MLAISSLGICQCLLRLSGLTIAPCWGWQTLSGLSPGNVSLIRLRLHRWARPQQGGGVWDVRGGKIAGLCGGGTRMATALVDLYGGEDFEPFDRIILPEAY